MAATPVAITVHRSLNHGTGTDHPGPMIVTSKCRACEMNCSGALAERIVHERVSPLSLAAQTPGSDPDLGHPVRFWLIGRLNVPPLADSPCMPYSVYHRYAGTFDTKTLPKRIEGILTMQKLHVYLKFTAGHESSIVISLGDIGILATLSVYGHSTNKERCN